MKENLNKRYLFKEDDFKVFAVNGDAIRNNGFIDFIGGGHYYVDDYLPEEKQFYCKFIPKDEIWLEDTLLKRIDDLAAIFLHEKVERYIMKHYGVKYEKAHDKYANEAETIYREQNKGGLDKKLLGKIFKEVVTKCKKKEIHETMITKKQMIQVITETINEETYFNTFSGAVQFARLSVEKRGLEIDEDDWFREINTGQGKPKEGQTTRATIGLFKDGKPQKRALHIQVCNIGNSIKNNYELNYYVS